MKKQILFIIAIVFPLIGFSQGVTVYEHINFQGQSMPVVGDIAFLGNGWNDRISSIRIDRGYRIQIYADANYSGASMILDNDWTVTNSSMQWNDKISCIRIISRPGNEHRRPEQTSRPGYSENNVGGRDIPRDDRPNGRGANDDRRRGSITVFEHANFQGRSMNIDQDMPWVGNDWNDKISSIRIPYGMEVVVYFDGNYQGAYQVFTSDWNVATSLREWNDKISSVRIRRR